MMQATQGYGYATETIDDDSSRRKSKKYRGAETSRAIDPDVIEVQAVDRGTMSARPSYKRARPSELETNARMIGAADRRSKSRGKSQAQDISEKDIEAGRLGTSKSKSKSRRADRDPEKT